MNLILSKNFFDQKSLPDGCLCYWVNRQNIEVEIVLIILPISVLRVVAMVLVQIVVVLWSLMMSIEVLWSLMMPFEVQVALVRTRSRAVLCLLENREMKKSEHDFVTFQK